MTVRVIALGNALRGDDGAALKAAAELQDVDVVLAGRPGAGLLELLDPGRPTVICDVVQSGRPPGTVHRLALAEVAAGAVRAPRASSHGFGPGDALALATALGQELPVGLFVGIEGGDFAAGDVFSPAVAAALPAFVEALRAAVRELGDA